MTRKHYVALAAALAENRPSEATPYTQGEQRNPLYEQWAEDVAAVAEVLARDNPRFDRDRFWTAATR